MIHTNNYSYAFASDNTAPSTPEAFNMLQAANVSAHAPSYGADPFTVQAIEKLREWFEYPVEVFFVFSGTASNALALASLRKPYGSVFCAGESHIEKDETAAPEFFAQGLKLHLISDARGDKLNLSKAAHTLRTHRGMHSPKPCAISITQTTEFGTFYSADELAAIRDFAQAHQLYLHMDGARFANALAHSKKTPAELSWKAGVDVLSLGGTKNGVCTSEALVYFNRDLAADMPYRRKQGGQLLSKMRFLSAPWLGAIDQFVERAKHANQCAQRLSEALTALGFKLAFPTQANGVFVHLSENQVALLEAKGWHFYWFYGADIYRFMCAWNTEAAAIDALIADFSHLNERIITCAP